MSARWSAREHAWSRLIADGRCFFLARASQSVLHHSRDDVAPLLQITADAWRFCAMRRRDGRRTVAYDVAQAGRTDAAPAHCWPTATVAWMRRLVERCWSTMRVARVTSRALPPRVFVGCGAAVASRRSGEVVTAGLISSRVWFGPVPGSP
ncbi:topoisomerase II [Dorcoceras hygrometricum]|uniref:Topoisomerase II n=1 Tax=Dorcoceras hygrometricum TaxID=472368 RepID=A0A2Z7A3F0_9LAMI|nr:topoisomerase II [Dorcoceras hygrometricum]